MDPPFSFLSRDVACSHYFAVRFAPISQQAQLYFSGKSRYLGVYGSKEQASLAYEIAREVLKADQPQKFPASAEDVDRNFALARKAAEAGVTEQYG